MTRRRVLVAAAGALLLAATAVIVFVQPFGTPSSGEIDNSTATSVATIERRDLSSQTQVSATLGYAGASTIAMPNGTTTDALQQATQQRETALTTLRGAETALAADRRALADARAKLAADRAKQSVDCNASAAGASCIADARATAGDMQAVAGGQSKVATDTQQVSSARTSLADAEAALAEADSSAACWDQTSVYTRLPAVGAVVRRGGELYAIDGEPVLLLYGGVPQWRAFRSGMQPGRDVAELNASLDLAGDAFTPATAAAVRALQARHGLPETGELLLGSIVFEPGAVRVTSVTPTRGSAVQAGPVLGVTSTRRIVTIALDASAQTSVRVGDPVVITLPDNSTTPGHVSYVGTVATTPSGDSGNGSSTPTIDVRVTPSRPAETGRLDQAPVDVSITTETARGVLVAPVDALLSLASGGYAVEAIGADGAHRLVAVQLGLFDDAQGLVEVHGSGVHAGLRVVVPGS